MFLATTARFADRRDAGKWPLRLKAHLETRVPAHDPARDPAPQTSWKGLTDPLNALLRSSRKSAESGGGTL